MFKELWQQRELIVQLSKRELQNRYRGSALGFIWSFITPLMMLCIYTFVFGVIFTARWSIQVDSKLEFALILFCGLSVFGIFAESITRAPGIILGHTNFIKRVVFPLEVLPVTLVISAVINTVISILILILAALVLTGHIYWTAIYFPLVVLPLILIVLGLSWFLASLGVYLRDINQIIPIAVSAMMFLSPIFYPVTAIPESFRWVYYINPISYVVEDARRIIIWGQPPDWYWLGIGSVVGLLVAMLGFYWFQKTRKGFADVV